MQAIILAAGMGVRLGGLILDRPKALLPVCGRELILRVMDFLDHPAITGRIVITGFMADTIESFMKGRKLQVATAHNPNYSDGSIRTIETAMPFVKDDFLIMNADHIYPKKILDIIVKQKTSGVMAVCDFDRKLADDDMKVKLNGERRLKFISKKLADYDGGYIGMTFCSREALPKYRAAVSKVRSVEGDGAAVERALGQLAAENYPIDVCDASGVKWLEVDTPDDLKNAEAVLNSNKDFLS